MALSTSRQQFLAYETQPAEEINYGRKGGIFVSTCICVTFILLAVVLAALVGVIVYFMTYFKLSQNKTEPAFWDETEPFGNPTRPSPDLRLPAYVVPSFYRLKLHADIENSNFTGEVYITIRASKPVKEIVLHSKDLNISNDAILIEQIYESVETLHTKYKREINKENDMLPVDNVIGNETKIDQGMNNLTDAATSATTINGDIQVNAATTKNTPDTPALVFTRPPAPVDTQVTHSTVRNIKIISIAHATGDRLVLRLASSLSPDVDYTLQLSFSGHISNALTGFYMSTYKNSQKQVRKLGVTQFEPTSARAAFPCFDEPAFKAMFEISIAHPQNVTVLSNMKASTHEPFLNKPDWQWTHFERSVNMSTYLVAYVLSDFQSVETSYLSKDNITKTIKIWARPELIGQTKYALNITPKLLSYYEDVFGLPYALDKIDLIAIPDFSSGAMENWGLVTFRETTLLFNETQGVPREKQNVAIDIAHELAHQWFGNLVTMRWWTDLWLNEGFATYIEYVGVDYIEPEWNMFESFIRDKMDLLRSDALKNTSPVSRRVIDASEISQKFDEISYNKGANLIRMLNHTISEELFHKGLLIYLNDWKYTNAEENDLWKAMAKATASDPSLNNLSVVEFMNTWTKQAGYPVVKVNRNYEKGIVELEQRLFTNAKDPYQKMIDQLWHIPLSYATLGRAASDWSTKPKTWLKERFHVINEHINETDALYINVDAIGYYRVNYDKRNWELLSAALKSNQIKSAVAKAQLIDDAFNLAKVAQLDYSYALGLTTCVADGEDSKIVWEMVLNNMGFLKHNLKATSGYMYFQDYMRSILKKQLQRLNYGLDKPKNDNEAFLIENLVMWECYMESPRCLDWARNEFNKWMNQSDFNDNPIPSYLRGVVCHVALKYGARREFDFLWDVFERADDPAVRSLAATCLPAARQPALLAALLEKSITEIPKQYAVAVWSVEGPVGTRVAQQFVLNNFERVHGTFTEMDSFMLPTVLNGAFGSIADEDDLDKLKAFAVKYKEKLVPMSQTLQKLIDAATLRINWIKRYAADINQWFQGYGTNSTSTIARSSQEITTEAAPTNTNITIAPTTDTNITNAPTADTNITNAPTTDTNITGEPTTSTNVANTTSVQNDAPENGGANVTATDNSTSANVTNTTASQTT
ncbi:hypothetical protein ACJJTC_018612 [Scirpophaga incertulas]